MPSSVHLSSKDKREIVDLFREAMDSAGQMLRDTPGWWHALNLVPIPWDSIRRALSVDAVTIDTAQGDFLVSLAITDAASAKPGSIASITFRARADQKSYSPVELDFRVCIRDYDEDLEDNRFWDIQLTYAGWKWQVH